MKKITLRDLPFDPTNEGDFVQQALDFLCDNGFSISLVNKKSVDGSAGYMSKDRKKVVVATGQGDWLSVFIHEVCHVIQSIYETEWWNKYWNNDMNIFEPSTYENEDEDTIRDFFFTTMKMEEECDKIALAIIDDFYMDPRFLDREEYVQASNCYHASHYYFWSRRCFYDPKHTPYKHPELLQLFSNERITRSRYKFRPRPVMDEFFDKYSVPL
jgi:hypothetical protein